MIRIVFLTALVFMFCGGRDQQARAALFMNGSFESGIFDGTHHPGNPAQNTDQLAIGSTDISGWTVFGDELAWIGPGNSFGVVAADGGYLLDLTGYSDRVPHGGVRQDFDTIVGHQYLVSFAVGAKRANASIAETSSLNVSVGPSDGPLATTLASSIALSTDYTWQTNTVHFAATTATSRLAFQGVFPSNNLFYIGLDNVNIVDLSASPTVPEPTSLVLWGLGGLVCAAGTSRRRY